LPGTSAPLNTPLGPGESYFTTFLFDVAADARNPGLLISDVDPVSASSGPSRKQPAARKNLSGTKPKRSRYGVRLAVNPLFSAPWFHHIATNLP
jgi:hypothetical protein